MVRTTPGSPKRMRMRRAAHDGPRPFLKWVGGKAQLLPELALRLPPAGGYERYFEPFVGGGALFFALQPAQATLTDVNAELVDAYLAVRDDVDGLIRALGAHRYDEDHYYEVRGRDPAKMTRVDRAARTIYLNKAGFNGLYRVNSKGLFNVPFGRYTNPKICDEANLRLCSQALAGVAVEVRDYAAALAEAAPGDFVYLDPPYAPLSATSSFTSYSVGGFGPDDQVKLAEVFRDLTRRRVRAMLSNSATETLRTLYDGYLIDTVPAARRINSNGKKRGSVDELIVRNYGPQGGVQRVPKR